MTGSAGVTIGHSRVEKQLTAWHTLAMDSLVIGAPRRKSSRRSVGLVFSDDELALLQVFVMERAAKGSLGSALAEGAAQRGAGKFGKVAAESELRALRRCFSAGWFSPSAFARITQLAGLPADELLRRVRAVSRPDAVVADQDLCARLAYQVWVHVNFRVIAQRIDWQHDDLLKVYDSWYEAFGEIRRLIADSPLWRTDARSKRRVVCELCRDVLHEMRIHLTHWQSRYRDWHLKETAGHRLRTKAPAQVLEEYGQRGELKRNFEVAQARLIALSERLAKQAFPPRAR